MSWSCVDLRLFMVVTNSSFFSFSSEVRNSTFCSSTIFCLVRVRVRNCIYNNIEVAKRYCQNIVAKGTLSFEIDLERLKKTYVSCVEYDDEHFEHAFKKYYSLTHKQVIAGSGRVLYLFTKK